MVSAATLWVMEDTCYYCEDIPVVDGWDLCEVCVVESGRESLAEDIAFFDKYDPELSYDCP